MSSLESSELVRVITGAELLACAIVGLAVLSGRVLAQPAEEPEEIIVRAKPLNRYRAEIELARDEMIELFNEANEGDDKDVRCRYDVTTGSRIPVRVCFSAAQDRASAGAARDLLNGLFLGRGAETVGAALNEADGESRAMLGFEKEWRRVMATNEESRDAAAKYRELENEFDRARGETIRIPIPSFALKGPQCEASTYTEYEQRDNVAPVTGRVSISACPAGTTGKFALIARVRDRGRRDHANRVQRDVAERRRVGLHLLRRLSDRRQRFPRERARTQLDVHLRGSHAIAKPKSADEASSHFAALRAAAVARR